MVLNIINKYTSHSQSALRTKLMMMKVTLLWKAKGGPALPDVTGGGEMSGNANIGGGIISGPRCAALHPRSPPEGSF